MRERPAAAVLRRLWERMAAIYLHRWTTAVGTTPQKPSGELTLAGDSWSRGLAGMSDEQIRAGLNACLTRTDNWPPVLSEFRALCLQIPDFDDTRMHVTTRGVTDHPFYRLVWLKLDVQTFRSGRHFESEKALQAAYSAARKQVLRDLRYPDKPAGELPPPAPTPKEFDFTPPPAPTPAQDEIRRLNERLGDHTPPSEPSANEPPEGEPTA